MTESESLESLYFKWLYSKVCDPSETRPGLCFYKLLEKLHQTEFVFLISGDDNRVEDGRDLRLQFFRESFISRDDSFLASGCSVLEVLVAFSFIASFETDYGNHYWFWLMLSNLGIDGLHDAARIDHRSLQDVLDRFIFRTYDGRGNGGLFPLLRTKHDQRKVEIWYQFNEYLFEMGYD